jgi:uncharacterized protein YndB with AHSA1/START domain
MTTATSTSVRVSRRIRATQERLFRAWTDPKEIAHWWRMEGDGWAFAGASVDARVGGKYRLEMNGPGGMHHVAVGEYQEVERPTRLAFTWNVESKTVNTLVTVELNDVGGGETEVVITHERFVDATSAAGHEKGWTELLRLLDRAMQAPAA